MRSSADWYCHALGIVVIALFVGCSGCNRQSVQNEMQITVPLRTGDVVCRAGTGMWSDFFRMFSPRDRRFSHAGIVLVEQDGKVFVIHAEADDFTAVGKVYQQPLERYVRNSRAAVVFRLQSPHPVLEDPALAAAAIRQYLSCPFDAAFDLKTPKSLYCTELVYRFFADITPAIHLKTKRYFWKECVPVDSCCDPDFFAELQTLKK